MVSFIFCFHVPEPHTNLMPHFAGKPPRPMLRSYIHASRALPTYSLNFKSLQLSAFVLAESNTYMYNYMKK